MNWRIWETAKRNIVSPVLEDFGMTDHICPTPTPHGWVPGMLWTCLGCGDVWVLMASGAWDKTDLNLHSRSEPPAMPEPLPPPIEWGVRIANPTGIVDMRCEDQDSAENLVELTNRAGSGDSKADLIWRQLGSATWQSAPTAESAIASNAPHSPQIGGSPGWPTS